MQIKNVLLAASLATIAYAQAPEEGDPKTVTGALGDAAAFESPKGETKPHVADFTGTKLSGSILFHPYDDQGVHFVLNMAGFPAEGGPFGWHIHDQPVPTDGNCTGTKAHLDPYQRGQKVACDSDRPESCEVGDLAGKFGKIPADSKGNYSVSTDGIDKYITLQEGVGSFIGNRSVVIHLADGSRYACANITVLKEMHTNNTGGHGDPEKPEEGAAVALGPGFWSVAAAAAGLAAYLL